MKRFTRRHLLGLLAAMLPAAALARFAPPPAARADDPLLLPAAAWIASLRAQGDTVLLYPISRLQRRFRIGYHHTLALMDALERRGDWTIAHHDDGTRYARLDTKGQA